MTQVASIARLKVTFEVGYRVRDGSREIVEWLTF
jgi:hypothetical protein